MAVLLTQLFTEGKPRNALITCVLVSVFPQAYLGTAGYIATCTNYLYPLAGLLFLACQVRDMWTGGKTGVLCYLLALPVMAYVLNQDQAACILLGGLLLTFCGALCRKEKRILLQLGVYFLMAAVGYGIMFMIPGHLNRMADPTEMNLYLPEYANWSVGEKIYRGYSSTIAQVFIQDKGVCVLFFYLLFILCQEKQSLLPKVLSALPLCGFFLFSQQNDEQFVSYNCGMPDLRPLSTWGGVTGLLFCTGCLVIMVYLICRCVSPLNRWLLLGVLTLGAGSRLMMGFSATIYASQQRTFTYLLFSLLMGCLILLREMKNSQQAGEAAILMAFLLK